MDIDYFPCYEACRTANLRTPQNQMSDAWKEEIQARIEKIDWSIDND